MKKVKEQIKRTLSIVLVVAMVVTCVPQTGISALAAAEEPVGGGVAVTAGTEESADLTVPSETSDDDTAGGEEIEKDTLTDDQTAAEDGEQVSGNELDSEESVMTYTVTLPESPAVTVEITGGAGKDGAVYKADGESDVTFTAAAAEGNEIVTVQYTVDGNDAAALEEQEGVYTIPADAVTGDVVILVETNTVAEDSNQEALAETVTVTFDGNTDKVSIYTVEKSEDGSAYHKNEQPVSDNVLTANKGEELLFSVETADKYMLRYVALGNDKLHQTSVWIDTRYVPVYRLTPESDQTVTITARLDQQKANYARFISSAADDYYFKVSTDGKENDDTIISGAATAVFTAKDRIRFTVTPEQGYKIDQITQDREVVETADAGDGAVSFETAFTPDPDGRQTRINYLVAVSAVGLEADGGRAVLEYTEGTAEVIAAVVQENDNVIKAADNQYEIKSGAQYVEFTLTRANDKITPVVHVGSRLWKGIQDGNDYRYKVSASFFVEDTTITIDTEADKRNLTVMSYDIIPEPVLMVVGDEYELTGEAYTEVYEDNSECNFVDYTDIDVDSLLNLVITPNDPDNDQIISYRINDGEICKVEDNKIVIEGYKLEYDTVIEINPAENDPSATKTITVKANPDEVDVLVGEGASFGEFVDGAATRSEQQGTELTLYVKAKANSVIESYQINEEEPVIPEDGKNVSISVTLTDDVTVTVNSSCELSRKLFEWRDGNDTEVQAENNVYSVDYGYGVVYTAMVTDKAGEAIVLSDAEISEAGSGAAPASTVDVAVEKGSRFAQIRIDEADAGKRLRLKLWENRDGVQNVAAVYELQVRAENEPVYASKITLIPGARTITTGQQDVKIADVTFDDKATCREILSVVDDRTGAHWISGDSSEGIVRVYVKDNAVYMSIDPNVDDGNYDTDILGKHTIRVAAAAENRDGLVVMEPAAASITVTVVQGIHDLELTAPTYQIYKANNMPASLKTTLVYNGGVKAAAPKVKTVEYSLVEAQWDDNGDITDVKYERDGLTVDAKGIIKVEKNYIPDGKEFCVKVRAKDFDRNEAAGYTAPLKVEGSPEKLTAVYIVKEVEINDETEYEVVAKTKGEEPLTSGDLDGMRVIAVTEKAEEDEYGTGDIVKKYQISNLHSPSGLTYKSNNNALSIDKDGIITVNKANPKNNITITVTANDGGKSSAKLEKLAIQYATPMLGLRVERMDDHAGVNDVDSYRWIDERDFVESNSKNETDYIAYTAASDSVLRLTVVGKYQEDEPLHELGECVNFTVAVSGAKVLKKEVSPYGQVVTTVIPNKKDVVVTLTDKAKNKTARYKLTNNGFYTEAAKTLKPANIKTTDKLWANKEDWQEIRYTVTLPAELENFADNYVKAENGKKHQQDELYVMVKTDAADRSNAKKAAAYRSLEEGGSVNDCRPVEDIEITKDKNGKTVVTGTFRLDFWGAVAAGSYKLQMTFGTNSNENDETYNEIEPLTKAVAVNLKAAAVKKGSYKPFTAAKMSVKDKTYVEVAGTGKNFTGEEYRNLRNMNYNDGRYNIRFTDYFELFYDEEDSGRIVGLQLKPGLSDGTLKWLTGNAPDARAACSAYMEYAAYNEDGSVLKSGTVKFTVSFTGVVDTDRFDKLKTVNAYAAPGVKVMENTQKATVKVTAAKKSAALAYVYAEDTTKNIEENQKLYCWGWNEDRITLGAENPLSQKKHNITLYIVPDGSYYQREIEKLDDGSDSNWDEKVVPKIKARGIKVTTTVTVVKKATGSKIAVDRKELTQRFVKNSEDGMRGYWGPDQNYWIDVPFTYNVEGVDIAEIETDKGVAEVKSNNGIIGFGKPDERQCISISLSKNDIARVRNTKTNNKTKEKSVKVKATIFFCIPSYDSVTGEVIRTTDVDIKTEDITFNLTLPEEPKVGLGTYAEALANVKANRTEIEKITPGFWNDMYMDLSDEWQGTYYLHEDSEVTDDEGNTEWRHNDLYDAVSGAIWAVEEKLREYAPEDSDTVIEMTQHCHWEDENGSDDWIELSTDDFTAPTYGKPGKLVIRARLNNADRDTSYNEADGTFRIYEEMAFTLTIPAAKEQPGDVETVLQEFIRKAQAGGLVYDLSTNNTEQDMIEREARAYTKLRTYRTLRLDIWDFEKEPSTEDTVGFIRGILHVYGNRYGGEEIMIPFELVIPKRNIAVENHKAALDDIIWTCMDRIGEINGIANRDYDSYRNTFTVTLDPAYDNKSVKAEMDAWREQNKDNLDLYKNTLAGKLEAVFGEDWNHVSSVSVIAEGSVRVMNPITGEEKELDRVISDAKVVKKQEGETIQHFADRLYDQLLANEDEYLEKCNEYLQKYDKDMTVDKIPFSFLHRATGNIRLAVNYIDGATISQTYKLNVK